MTEQKNHKIILSADSTCDLDEEIKKRYHVNYFPLHINLNGEDYLDNITITPEQVYQEYYDHKVLPKTSAVNVEEYMEHFRPWVEQGYEVIHVNLGHALSSSLSELLPGSSGTGACPCRGQLQSLHRNRPDRLSQQVR